MPYIDSYIINSVGGRRPIFEPLATTKIPYSSENIAGAASVDAAKKIVDEVMSKMSNLTYLLCNLENQILNLADYWNNFIVIDGKAQEIVPLEDLMQEVSKIKDSCINGQGECDKILDDYSETINSINDYLEKLANNYNEYSKLLDRIEEYKHNISQIIMTVNRNGNQIEDMKRLEYLRQQLKKAENKLEEYVKINDVTEYGVWVKE